MNTGIYMPVLKDPDGDSNLETRCDCMGDGRPLLMFWFKQDGDSVEEGESLFEIEAGWKVQDINAPVSGTLHILESAEQKIEEGKRIAFITSD